MTEAITAPSVGHADIRAGSAYGSFFWQAGTGTLGDGRIRHWATWCVHSSYGAFSHYWYHMGSPFADFVQDVKSDYLLSKIGRMVFDEEKFTKWLRREIFTSRASRQQKLEASRALREILSDYSGESIATLAYASDEISHCQPEWCDSQSRSYDSQAVGFATYLWPKFVTHLRGEA